VVLQKEAEECDPSPKYARQRRQSSGAIMGIELGILTGHRGS